jgi:DNA modification methylase
MEAAMALVKDILGWFPISVWNLDKNESDKWKLVKDCADTAVVGGSNRHSGLYKKMSVFNPALAARVYLYWSKEGDIIVDPFAGRTTRGMVAVMLGRNYFGYEVVPKVVEMTKANLVEFQSNWKPDEFAKHPGSYVIYQGDGCQLKLTPPGYADLVFTCPPYHQLEKYESCKGQLSDIKDYDIFLHSLLAAGTNCMRVLKPGGFCVWVVADWRLNGQYHCFHGDLIELFAGLGFELWDVVINQLRTPAVQGVGMAAQHYRTIKAHEYVLVWRKPGYTDRSREGDIC